MSNRPNKKKLHLLPGTKVLGLEDDDIPDILIIEAGPAKEQAQKILKKAFDRERTLVPEGMEQYQEARDVGLFQGLARNLIKSCANQLIGALGACSIQAWVDTANTGDERYALFATTDPLLAKKLHQVIEEHCGDGDDTDTQAPD